MIDIIDDFFDDTTHRKLFEFCTAAKYTYGECDEYGLPPVGMVSDIIPDGNVVYEIFKREIKKEYNLDHDPYRMYVNLFTPGEQPFWHRDGKTGLTFLYYPNLVWEPNCLGETQFMIEGEIRGIVPKPNRLVGFDANISHRATTFRKDHRFTIAIKFYG